MADRFFRKRAAAVAACLIFACCGAARAEPLKGREYLVKAGFIYNFAKFVRWPDETEGRRRTELTLCIFSDHPETDVYFSLNGKTVRGREFVVVKADPAYPPEICDIAFFSSQDRAFIRKILKALPRRGVLTIGETDGFTRMGGVVNFFVAESRLRFRVNIDAADAADLSLSSQLLMSAEIVRGLPKEDAE